jgi:hypothetical protein
MKVKPHIYMSEGYWVCRVDDLRIGVGASVTTAYKNWKNQVKSAML